MHGNREGTSFDLILRGGTVVSPGKRAEADIGVRDGTILRIGDCAEAGGEVLDARGLHILPGVIDSHVHFREPGGEHKETLRNGSRAAVLGGVTAVFDMPNTQPPVVDDAALEDKRARAAGNMHCDYAFYVGASRDNSGWLAEAERQPAVAGVKLFMGSSTGDLLVGEDAGVRAVLEAGRRRVAVHAEDEPRLQERLPLRRGGDPASHSIWRDAEAAAIAIRRLARLTGETGRPVHVLHVSTRAELEVLAAHRGRMSVEATPHHLTLVAEDAYDRLGTGVQVNPPLRVQAERDALFAALRGGLLDTLGSDHAPHTRTEKAAAYPESPSGIPGTATLLPVMLEHVAAGRLGLDRLVSLVSEGPARVFGIQGKGRIAEGFDADLTLVDLGAEQTLGTGPGLAGTAGSPYAGMRVRGGVVATVVRGHVVMREGEIAEPAVGAPVRFREVG